MRINIKEERLNSVKKAERRRLGGQKVLLGLTDSHIHSYTHNTHIHQPSHPHLQPPAPSHTPIGTHICPLIFIHPHIHIHVQIYMNTRIQTCTPIPIYRWIQAYIHTVHTYKHTHPHTDEYKHTHIQHTPTSIHTHIQMNTSIHT